MPINPSAIISGATTKALSTEIPQVPTGEFLARVADLKSPDDIEKKWWRENKRKDDGSTFIILSVPVEILDENVKKQLKRDHPIVYLDLFLDFNDQGGLSEAEGDNVGLGQLYSAVGMKGKGQSINRLPGAGPMKVIVKHRDTDKGPRAYVASTASARD